MADFDSADMLARVKELTGRDKLTSDASMTDANWYRLLSDGQKHWSRQIAIHCPGILGWTSATLSSADSGATYTFASSITPLAVEIYSSSTGRFMVPAWYPDGGGDYVWEGDRLRAVRGGTISTAPFARYVVPPTVIDGSTAPTMKPSHALILCVYRAAILWASRGGLRDPKPFQDLEDRAWYGEPKAGDGGILLWLKQQNAFAGAAAYGGTPQGLDYIYLSGTP